MRTAAVVFLVLVAAATPVAPQRVPDASGHWAGSVDIPNMPIDVEVDFARSTTGQMTGTVSIPSQKIRGLPLTKIQQSGLGITFEGRTDQGFAGTLSVEGNTMSGYYRVQDYTFPFILTRTGAADIAPPPTSPRIGNELEGTWNATLTAGNARMRAVLTLANRPDGRSTGTVTNLDQGSLQIPVATITQAGPQVTLGFTVVEASFSGTSTPGVAN